MDAEIIDLTDSIDVELSPQFDSKYADNRVNTLISDEVNEVKVALVHTMETDGSVDEEEDADNSASVIPTTCLSTSQQGSPDYSLAQETDCLERITILSVETVKEDETENSSTSEETMIDSKEEITKADKPDISSEGEADEKNNDTTLNESFNEETASTERFSIEELRKKISAQLDSLRTRKNLNVLKSIKQTVDVDKPPDFTKPILISDIIENTIESILPTPDPQTQSDSASSTHDSQEDAPNNVFNEIRKIINKPKSNKQSFETSTNLPPVGKIFPRNIEDLLDKKHLNLEKNDDVKESSPFVSITLDEFLNNAKLNVSYAIPKSGAEEGLTRNYPGEPITPVQRSPQETSNKEKSKLEVGYKPKTLAEKRRLLELDNMKRKRRRKSVRVTKEDEPQNFVLFRNKRIYVKSKNSSNKCLAVVESTQEELPKVTRFRKPSLIQQAQLKYAPGPLSKKPQLQNDYSEFSTEIKKLPSVQLYVIPEIGRPVHPNLIPVVTNKWDCNITDEQAEFSLAALFTSPTPNKTVFTFDVPYKNQQKTFLVRRTVPQPSSTVVSRSEKIEESVLDEVKKTIDGLINYVEIKEIGDSIIKDECIEISDPPVKSDEEISPGKKKRVYNRLNKVSRELRRLNCKVLSLEANEPKLDCRKAHCRLGCVCKSLQCDTIIGLHCKHVKCIFGCVCPERQTNLTLDTAIRIGDEAKKNLAKEEKEFTQTIIYSNDKPIVVGPGRKSRRARAPIKYNDYVAENDDVWHKPTDTSSCTVSLENWDFSEMIPYCLVHHLYNCHCHGSSTKIKRIRKPKYPQQPLKPETSSAIKTETVVPATPNPEPVSCARTSEVPAKYRNHRSARSSKTATLWDFERNFDETDVHFVKMAVTKNKELTECEAWKKAIIEESQLQQQQQQKQQEASKNSRVKHNRKQQLNVRQEEPIFNPVFDGEVLLSNAKIMRELGVSLKEPLKSYARILPWAAFLKGFRNRSINVYCLVSTPLRLVLNTGAKLVEDKLLDITAHGTTIMKQKMKGTDDMARQSQKVINMINWLLTGKVTGEHNPSILSFLLIESLEGRFEVRGVCTPKQEQRNDLSNGLARGISRCRYKLRTYVEQDSSEVNNEDLWIWAGLPNVKNTSKWRMIFLKEKFIYLHFKKISYVLKYEDLMYLTKAAEKDNVTYRLRAEQMVTGYEHPQFGVFISSVHSDRIFVGPYLLEYDDEDVETLKYVDSTLVSTEMFEKIKTKNGKQRCGLWMIERNPKRSEPSKEEIVDLTGNGATELAPSESKKPRLRPEPTKKLELIRHVVRVKDLTPRTAKDFNRYIITNIPHFGYLGAFQPDNSTVLQVSWPLENKYLQFERTEHAVSFIEERFNELLLPIPETFKIRVIVLTDLDLDGTKPIDAAILTGHWVCGQFGIYNFKAIDEAFCAEKLKKSRKEIMKMFADRSYAIMSKRFNELVAALGIVEPDSFFSVLRKAAAEIKSQEQLRLKLAAEMEQLEKAVVEKTKKVFSLIEPLPREERAKRAEELKKIIAIRPKRRTLDEVIEIKDDEPSTSDSTSIPSSNNMSNVTLKFKPTCTVTAPEEN